PDRPGRRPPQDPGEPPDPREPLDRREPPDPREPVDLRVSWTTGDPRTPELPRDPAGNLRPATFAVPTSKHGWSGHASGRRLRSGQALWRLRFPTSPFKTAGAAGPRTGRRARPRPPKRYPSGRT